MRIKAGELVVSVLFLGIGIAGIVTGEVFLYGIRMPEPMAYAFLGPGIAILILAWFLRSPKRKGDEPDE